MTTTQIPSPIYAGNAITTGVTFSNPVVGQPSTQWPPVDPTTVTLTFVPGTGGTPTTWVYGTDIQITQVSTGVYSAELDTTDAPGRWSLKWVGTDACAAVWVQGFSVVPQPF